MGEFHCVFDDFILHVFSAQKPLNLTDTQLTMGWSSRERGRTECQSQYLEIIVVTKFRDLFFYPNVFSKKTLTHAGGLPAFI